jgi:trypsin-like peptidase
MDNSEQLVALFKRCTVRLLTPKESGTGFFVAPGFILTCAHVVGNVESDKVPVTVQWEEKTYLAQIVRLVSDPYPDLALLKLEDAPPSHLCVLLHPETWIGDDLYGYGYSDLYPNGEPSSFKFEGTTGTPSTLMKFKSGEVRQGLSGGPLFNMRTGGVCGVMKLTRGANSLMGGRGISSTIIFEQFPELLSLQQDFHRKDSRWYDFLTLEQRQRLGIVIPHTPGGTIEVYYSFAKTDEKFARELQKHLILLKREQYIVEWYPGEVILGQEPSALNKQHLDTAHIILLLVSSDFFFEKGSSVQDNYEMNRAVERSKTGAIVIPIKLRQVQNWDLAPFGKLVSLPRNGKPVEEWTHIDAAFAEIAKEIRKVVDTLRGGR